MQKIKIVVVGGGPSGMMATIRAAGLGQDVTLLEKKDSVGNKLLLSGKGRCNLTNTEELEYFLKRFSKNGDFLRDAFKKFFNRELMDFFEQRGLKLKIERQMRVFPHTDCSASVLNILKKELEKSGVQVIYKAKVVNVLLSNGQVKAVRLENGKDIVSNKIILACGGASYSFTGSDAAGINIASKLGHSIVPLRPGLVPLDVKQGYPRKLEGLTLRNIKLKFSDGKAQIVSEIGELVFTASGISGPLVITLSGRVIDMLAQNKNVCVEIDFKPALSIEQLDNRLLRELKANVKKSIKNALKELLPLRLIKVFIDAAAIDLLKKCSQITQAEREKIVSLLKGFRMDISGARPIEEGMITRGGVNLKEINPRTMESRLIKGLYFCGEMIDVDADTGGFNLQAAFSTGYLAGESAAKPRDGSQLKAKLFPLTGTVLL
ncbi:MAG: NAD(P)/FAD-dependent oxidoreductase [Candidatus Omnitrophica bacterium]|nr:NAD(P)/FAD-dependent oxidoreductase [Candidatus Omnitrophota bacterium]MBU1922651.1 NAD(P)/FAD-dependent oxidoreductase [Candidatus Omnitrophota bacterium]